MDEQPRFVVEGARVALGPLRMDLVPTYQRWENDLEVANGNGRVIPFTLETERDRIAGLSGKPDHLDFTVYDRADQTPIGWSSLSRIDHRNGSADFGILLGERRDQGLGTEATRLTLDWGFTVLGLHNIMLSVAAWNKRAIRVYTKVGFREVGRRRGMGVTMGRRYDGVFMDLLATEFLRANESVLADRAPHGMAEAPEAEAVVEAFLTRQREMYAGGDLEAAGELLAEDVVWHVPGTSPIAGDYHGREAVTGYFRRRRALAGGAIRVTKAGEAHHEEALVQLADGRAPLGGQEVIWRTAGVYRVADGKISEAWLVPLDQEHFDRVWARTRPAPFVNLQRVRPQECAASSMLGHPRFLEFFEAAFIECWRDRFGSLDASLGPDRRLTVAAVQVRYLAPVRIDDELRIEVTLDRVTQRSIQVHYDAFVGDARVAEASSRYVCLDTQSGEPASLPDGIAGE